MAASRGFVTHRLVIRRALITGAAGRLGRRAVEVFAASGVAVTALVLTREGVPGADRTVVGDARDVDAVREALRDVDIVVHLAALPSPDCGTAEEVFCGNTAATFTVLEQAGLAGVRRAVIASSQAISGLPFGPSRRRPPYLPINESVPLQIADPYALSKATDEAIASMMWWRHGVSVCALRFPYLAELETTLLRRAAKLATDPSEGTTELWSYLDWRDAARACLLAAHVPPDGSSVVLVAAPATMVSRPTEWLLDTFLPDVPRRRHFAGNEVPLDLRLSQSLLGFEAAFRDDSVMTGLAEFTSPPWEHADGSRITRVRSIVTAPEGLPLVVVRVDTSDDGLYGLGCATFTQRFSAVTAVVDEFIARW